MKKIIGISCFIALAGSSAFAATTNVVCSALCIIERPGSVDVPQSVAPGLGNSFQEAYSNLLSACQVVTNTLQAIDNPPGFYHRNNLKYSYALATNHFEGNGRQSIEFDVNKACLGNPQGNQ